MPAPQPTEAQLAAVDRIARFVVRFGVALPALMALESLRPLSYVGSQFMHLLTPSLAVFLTPKDWEALAALLEHREGIDVLLDRIEALEKESRDA